MRTGDGDPVIGSAFRDSLHIIGASLIGDRRAFHPPREFCASGVWPNRVCPDLAAVCDSTDILSREPRWKHNCH